MMISFKWQFITILMYCLVENNTECLLVLFVLLNGITVAITRPPKSWSGRYFKGNKAWIYKISIPPIVEFEAGKII